VVVIVSVGSLVVTLNAKLLGGRVCVPLWSSVRLGLNLVQFRSFFQSLCVLGYCIFPLVLAAVMAAFVRILWIRAPVAIGAWAWSVWGEWASSNHQANRCDEPSLEIAAMNFFDGTKIEEQRVLLAVYPILYVNLANIVFSLSDGMLAQPILFHTCMDDTHTMTLTA
jgi:hypothetical protein